MIVELIFFLSKLFGWMIVVLHPEDTLNVRLLLSSQSDLVVDDFLKWMTFTSKCLFIFQ